MHPKFWLNSLSIRGVKPPRCEMDSAEGVDSADPAQGQESGERDLSGLTSDALQTINLNMNRMEKVLLEMQWSISSQGGLLEEIREAQVSQRPAAGSVSAPQSSRSILKKLVRTEEVEFIPVPPNSPQKLAVLPGEVKEVRVETGDLEGANRTHRTSSRSQAQERDRERRELVPPSRTMHAGTLDELSTIMARELLSLHSRSSSASRRGTKSLPLSEPERLVQNLQSSGQSVHAGERSESKKSHAAVLEKTQKLSLDELRTNHDAQALAVSTTRTSTDLETCGGMPFAAGLWMVFAGILRFSSTRLSKLWGLSLLLTSLATIVVLLWFSHTEPVDGATTATTICYISGVGISIWILRSDEVQELVGAQKGNLDMYARKRGFIKEWRRKSKARFSESIGFMIIMCASRWLGYSHYLPLLPDLFPNVAFCFAASGFTAISYIQLHILSGLELSIDSFSINFFRTMQIPDAIEEWNVVQATLRHVSSKLSRSLLVLGSSCCGASLLNLIDLAFVRSDVERGLPLILTSLWLLPPMFFFLYTMMRAASLTEKASRVSPLVNSWTFDSKEQPEDVPEWMDLGRQYLVNYMMQSEAGFYMQGIRLRIFQVTKMAYYLGAILFAVGTRILG